MGNNIGRPAKTMTEIQASVKSRAGMIGMMKRKLSHMPRF